MLAEVIEGETKSELDNRLCDIMEDMMLILDENFPGGGMLNQLARRALQEGLDERAMFIEYMKRFFAHDQRVLLALDAIQTGAHLR